LRVVGFFLQSSREVCMRGIDVTEVIGIAAVLAFIVFAIAVTT
jgi:hypothetical protein